MELAPSARSLHIGYHLAPAQHASRIRLVSFQPPAEFAQKFGTRGRLPVRVDDLFPKPEDQLHLVFDRLLSNGVKG